MRESSMIVSTKQEQFLLNMFKRGLDCRERENLWNIRKNFEILFVPSTGREDPEGFTLAKNIPAEEDVFIWKRSAEDLDPKSKGWEKLDTNLFSRNQMSGKDFSISGSDTIRVAETDRDLKPITSAKNISSSDIPKIFPLSTIQALFEHIQQKLLLLCANNHATFSHPSPLWKNPDFFIKLPFKLNEDTNPTKATHSGKSPSDLNLANEECNELLRQGLIEHTSSPWACQAFYVEKRSELLRGKKRLVMDYKPLNLLLRDDKFPVPRPNVLFSQLPGATIFSKFDLKGAFWQIGIHPDERYKTAFYLPNAQYQWTVLPFGLKTAPSLSQKAVTRISHPLLHSTLIYIDDILLFSPDETSHKLLLQ
ncbi:hypothetical protein LWI29_002314 [Acer saccharum]|uniref:Reverse transcriptase domain-containing protein n=1 Tax=Acer saccharum TaxID=4024 RepID=A0AA39TI24_ACESA|nr:hypothetical protein LWI29_002314 [Acer saccharum]